MKFNRLGTILFLIYLAPMMGLVAFDYAENAKAQFDSYHEKLTAIAEIQATRVGELLLSKQQQATLISSRFQLRKSLQSYQQAPEREELFRINKILYAVLALSPNIIEIQVFDKNKQVVTTTSSDTFSVLHSIRLSEGSYYQLHSIRQTDDHKLQFMFELPLEYLGKYVGGVRVVFDGQSLSGIVNDFVGLGETGETLLARLDSDGQALLLSAVRSQPELHLGEPLTPNLNLLFARAFKTPDYMKELGWQGLQSKQDVFVTSFVNNIGWGVVVRMQRGEMINGLLQRLAYIVAVIVVIGWLISLLVSRVLLVPLRRIAGRTQRFLKQENLRAPAASPDEPQGFHELVQLSANIRALMDRYEKTRDSLAVQVQKTTETLEGKSAELEAAQEHLIHSARLAALGELATTTAHEINQPLTAMNLKLQRAQRLIDKDQVAEALERIVESIELIGKTRVITDGLRTLGSRADRKMEVSDVGQVVTSALDVMSEQLSLSGIQIERPTVPSLLKVHANKVELEQVMVNLLSNAKDALSGLANSMIKVSVEVVEGSVFIRVSDNGKGIPSDQVDKIFDGYFSTKPTGDGTGIGLTISQKIIRSVGGEIFVETSRPGKTTVAVRLPHNKNMDKE